MTWCLSALSRRGGGRGALWSTFGERRCHGSGRNRSGLNRLALKGVLFRATTQGFGRAVVVRRERQRVHHGEEPGGDEARLYQELGLSVSRLMWWSKFFPWRLCALYNRKAVNVKTRGITDLTLRR